MADVVYAGDQFHIVGITTAGTGLSQTQFDPATDETLPTLSSITAPGTLIDVSAAPFDGGYVVATIQSGTAIHIRRVAGDRTIASGAPSAISGSFDAVAVAGGPTLYSVVHRTIGGGGPVAIRTYSPATFTDTLTDGPDTVFTATSVPRLGISINGAGAAVTVIASDDADTLIREVGQSSHALGTIDTYFDARLTCQPAEVSGKQFAVVVDREANTQNVGTHHIVELDNLIPQAFLLPQLAQIAN